MRVSAFQAGANRDARRAPRYPTAFDAMLRDGGRLVQISIRDISRVGALAQGADLPKAGSRVVLCARSLEVTATVVWAKDDSCGLNFHTPVDPLETVRQNMPGMEHFRTSG